MCSHAAGSLPVCCRERGWGVWQRGQAGKERVRQAWFETIGNGGDCGELDCVSLPRSGQRLPARSNVLVLPLLVGFFKRSQKFTF